ncbi:glycosyltransferase [Peribacillus asahii]|uniref:glycosyltransferase n=1 Tax=Peribacillus asahii TaxID=228899 RepID=UPI003CCC81D5
MTPVYNAEKYLRKTIDSVINQTIGFENIEYLLIDDCSTDSSRDILFKEGNV